MKVLGLVREKQLRHAKLEVYDLVLSSSKAISHKACRMEMSD